MRTLLCILSLLFSWQAETPAAEVLLVGDAAPALEVVAAESKEPLGLEEEAKRVTVVLFWATWSPPGRVAMAQLANLQQQAGAEVLRAVAVSTEPRGRVTTYLNLHAGEFGEVEFACDPGRATFAAYMTKAVERDVPRVFILDREGAVAWIGNPEDGFHTALEGVLAGDWSLQAHRQARILLLKARAAAIKGEQESLIELTHQLSQISAVYASYGVYHVSLLAQDPERLDEAWTRGRELLEAYPERPDAAHALARFILDAEELPNRDLELALAAAEQAVERSEPLDPRTLHTLAQAHFLLKHHEQAVQVQARAVALAEELGDLALLEEMQPVLQRYTRRWERVKRRQKNDG
jgi:thiol-disulfide isomerase/thioredoxin